MLIFRGVQTNTSELYMLKNSYFHRVSLKQQELHPPQQNSLISWWFNHRVGQYLSNLRHFPQNVQSKLVGGFNPSEKYSSNWKSSPKKGCKKKETHHLVNMNKNICETNAERAFCEANPSFYDIGSPALIHKRRHPPQ